MTDDIKALIDFIKQQSWCRKSKRYGDGLVFVVADDDGIEHHVVLDADGSLIVSDAQGQYQETADSMIAFLRAATGLPLPTIKFAVPPLLVSEAERRDLYKQSRTRIAAEQGISHWVNKRFYRGITTALFPDRALALLNITDGLLAAKALLVLLPDECDAFVERCDAAQKGFASRWAAEDKSNPLTPETAHDAVTTLLQRLWPDWPGWQPVVPRTHSFVEYVYNTGTDKYWDTIYTRPLSGNALNADVPQRLWPRIKVKDVDKPIAPDKYLRQRDHGLLVDAISWLPGRDPFVEDTYVDMTGMHFFSGARTLNLWRPGPVADPAAPPADRWLDLGARLFETTALHERFLDHMAYALQNPSEPVNGLIALLGEQGIGKDVLLLPLLHAFGYWNCVTVLPHELMETFNAWARNRIVIVNEKHLDGREGSSRGLYARLKSWTTTPPDMIQLNDKHDKKIAILKLMLFIITSNELAGFFMTDDDRRYLMSQSKLKSGWHIAEGKPDYFTNLSDWYRHGNGFEAVHRFLAERDVSRYDPMAPMPSSASKTTVQAISSEGDTELSLAVNMLWQPEIFFMQELQELAMTEFATVQWGTLRGLLNRSDMLNSRLLDLGYQPFPHPYGPKSEWAFMHTPEKGTQTTKRSRRAYVRSSVTKSGIAINSALRARGRDWAEGKLATERHSTV